MTLCLSLILQQFHTHSCFSAHVGFRIPVENATKSRGTLQMINSNTTKNSGSAIEQECQSIGARETQLSKSGLRFVNQRGWALVPVICVHGYIVVFII